MSALLALPLVVVLAGMAGARWRRGHGRDVRSITAHRSTLDVIEHVATSSDEADGHGRLVDPTAAHVRVLPPLEPPLRRRAPRRQVDGDGEPTELPRLPTYVRRPDRPVFPKERPLAGSAATTAMAARVGPPPGRRARMDPAVARQLSLAAADRAGHQRADRSARRVAAGWVRRQGRRVVAGWVRRQGPPVVAGWVRRQGPPVVAGWVRRQGRRVAAGWARRQGRRVAAGWARRQAGWFPPAGLSPRRAAPSGPDGGHRRIGERPTRPAIVAALTAAAAVVVIAGVALAVTARGGGAPRPQAVQSPASGDRARTAAPAPTTTVPTTEVVATSATSSDAVYSVNSAVIDVELSASGECWVEVRDGTAAGPIVFEGTIGPGTSRSFASDGTIWLRLGDPRTAELSVDGAPVMLPTVPDPFDVTLVGLT